MDSFKEMLTEILIRSAQYSINYITLKQRKRRPSTKLASVISNKKNFFSKI